MTAFSGIIVETARAFALAAEVDFCAALGLMVLPGGGPFSWKETLNAAFRCASCAASIALRSLPASEGTFSERLARLLTSALPDDPEPVDVVLSVLSDFATFARRKPDGELSLEELVDELSEPDHGPAGK